MKKKLFIKLMKFSKMIFCLETKKNLKKIYFTKIELAN